MNQPRFPSTCFFSPFKRISASTMAPGSMMTKKIILRQFLKMFLLWKWARAWGKAKGLRREVAHDQVVIFSMFGCSKPCNHIFVDQILDNNIDDRSWPGVPARCMLPSGKSTADGGRPLVIEHYRSPGMAFGRSKYLSVLDSPIITISHEFYSAQCAPLWQRIWLVSHAIPLIHLHTWGPQFT